MTVCNSRMNKCLFVVYLAGLWRASLSNECVRTLEEDVDFPGNDILQIFSPDLLLCQLACTQHHLCSFFTFLRSDWTNDNRQFYCYLKHVDSGANFKVTALKGATSGFTLRHCNDKQNEVCLSTVYKNVEFSGADYTSLFTDSFAECQKVCTMDPACQFFSYNTQDFPSAKHRHKCHLKYSRTLPTPPVVKVGKGMISGFPKKQCNQYSIESECRSMILKDTDFPGNDFEQVPAPSPEYCQILCTAHPRCTFFSFTTASFDMINKLLCFLKHNTEERVSISKANVMSGTPARFCRPSNACTKLSYENVDFTGANFREFLMIDSPAVCEAACTSDPDCHFYTYVSNTLPLPSLKKRCFLKQVITAPLPTKIAAKQGVVSGFHLRFCKQTTAQALTVSPEVPKCGLSQDSKEKVVGGSDATAGAWPWQVSLQVKSSSGDYIHTCGGSIISPIWIVTAAHCVERPNASNYTVSSGKVRLSEATEFHKVDLIIKHPSFDDATFENDIALFKLKTPLQKTALQGSVCLPDEQKEKGFWEQSCWVTGWGKLASGILPNVLQQAQVPLIRPEACNLLQLENQVYNNMLCAGYTKGGIDTCQGDSGGPLVCRLSGNWFLVGITSWGDGCGEALKPGVYTRVANYTDWIQSVMSR